MMAYQTMEFFQQFKKKEYLPMDLHTNRGGYIHQQIHLHFQALPLVLEVPS